jgi:hypothetical protein
VQLAAALAKLGRLDEARAAAARVLELHPSFRYSQQFEGVNCARALAVPTRRSPARCWTSRIAPGEYQGSNHVSHSLFLCWTLLPRRCRALN